MIDIIYSGDVCFFMTPDQQTYFLTPKLNLCKMFWQACDTGQTVILIKPRASVFHPILQQPLQFPINDDCSFRRGAEVSDLIQVFFTCR